MFELHVETIEGESWLLIYATAEDVCELGVNSERGFCCYSSWLIFFRYMSVVMGLSMFDIFLSLSFDNSNSLPTMSVVDIPSVLLNILKRPASLKHP